MNMRHAAEVLYDAADELQRDNDREEQEKEVIAALTKIAAAGFTTEADILASAAGVWSRWKPEGRSMASYTFDY